MSKFSDQLSQFVKLSGKSKNQIIDESKINRSSFFQFLNGKRMPTKEHLTAILAALQMTPGEEEQLRRSARTFTRAGRAVRNVWRVWRC